VNAVVICDRSVTLREIAEVDISTFQAHSILIEDLAMKRMEAKITTELQHIPRT